MGNAESPAPRPRGIPRWLVITLVPIIWPVGVSAAHAGIPWALSHLGPRYGWADGEPGGWNLLGYVPVAVGAADWLEHNKAARTHASACRTLKELIDEDVKRAFGHGIEAKRSKSGAITIRVL